MGSWMWYTHQVLSSFLCQCQKLIFLFRTILSPMLGNYQVLNPMSQSCLVCIISFYQDVVEPV